jgi:L-amino acid N-acyltransferase YncA
MIKLAYRAEDVAKMKLGVISKENYDQVAAIYLQGIATGMATFESQAPSWEQWDAKFLHFARITMEENKTVLGWGALAPTSPRAAYKGVAEVSVYISADYQSKGVGKLILNQLIEISEANNCWTLQSGIMPMNTASIALHRKCGFREIGFREKIGFLNDKWVDNVLFERRSKIVGV